MSPTSFRGLTLNDLPLNGPLKPNKSFGCSKRKARDRDEVLETSKGLLVVRLSGGGEIRTGECGTGPSSDQVDETSYDGRREEEERRESPGRSVSWSLNRQSSLKVLP